MFNEKFAVCVCNYNIFLNFRINTGFSEYRTLIGHTNFVSAVCVLPHNDAHPCLIVTGSNDHNIRAFTLDSATPIIELKGHSDTGKWI